jgi:hypothetical protein
MRFDTKALSLLLISSVSWPGLVSAENVDLLFKMAERLANSPAFSLSMNIKYDAVQKNGQKLQFSEKRNVYIQRPKYLRVDSMLSNGSKGSFVFDGEVITVFNQSQNAYSRIPHKGTVDSALKFLISDLGIRVPLARLFVTSLPGELKKLSSDISFVETNILGEQSFNHIAGRSKDVDYQVWISPDNLLHSITLTYKNAQGTPQFSADISNWDFSLDFKTQLFAFIPPKDAEELPSLLKSNKGQ